MKLIQNLAFAGLVLLGMLSGPGTAQSPPAVQPPPPVVAPPPAPPAAAAIPSTAQSLPVGTAITIKTIDAIDSKKSDTYTEYRASIDDAIPANGTPIVPKGAAALLRITEIKQAGKLKGKASLTLRLIAVNVNGQRISLETGDLISASASKGKTTGKSAGVGAAAGAGLGAIFGGGLGAGIGAAAGAAAGTTVGAMIGKRVKIPPESRLTFKLSQAVVLGGAAAPAPQPPPQPTQAVEPAPPAPANHPVAPPPLAEIYLKGEAAGKIGGMRERS